MTSSPPRFLKKATAPRPATVQEKRNLNLALQGGGSHGAYTWGVLNRLLEENNLSIDGISGASAGAMNAIALVQGYAENGRKGAIKALRHLWEQVSDMHIFSPVQRTPLDAMMGNWSLVNSPSYTAFDLLSRVASPYQLNPLGLNPLRILLHKMVDFKTIRACQSINLFISATSVRTGRARVFTRKELTADVIAASACLPTLYHAVEIDGEAYWDGGYVGNPVLWPLIYNCQSRDIMIVQINPVTRDKPPRTAMDIRNRIDEITFNSSLIDEMRAISFVGRLLKEKAIDPKRYREMLMHRIHSEAKLDKLDASSKMNAEWDFLTDLRDTGYAAADRWLRKNWQALGHKSTLDIQQHYLLAS